MNQAVSTLATVLITSLSIVRHHFYENFLLLHRGLAVITVIAIWIHVSEKLESTPTICLLATCGILPSLHILRICQILYRNVRNWRYSCRVVIESLPDAYQVHAKISRRWKYRAGQYVYLCIPLSYTAFFQSHPYMVSWWYKFDKEQDVVVFIIQRQRGFTQNLPTSSSKPTELRAIIEGPYGEEIHLDEYGTVLLFATGIGIAGQLPYMRQLLERFHMHDAKAKRIALFWQVDSESELHSKFLGTIYTDTLQNTWNGLDSGWLTSSSKTQNM